MTMVSRTWAPMAALALCAGLIGAAPPTAAHARTVPDAQVVHPAHAAMQMARWIVLSRDNERLPFAIIDKKAAMVFVFDARGELLGADVALVGLTPGDESTMGIGDRALADIAPEERTTPAGRFVGGYGPAEGGREVLWVDFSTAVSLHPVVTTSPEERRLERLKSPTPVDNRISYGCINVLPEFYEGVVSPTFQEAGGVFYVLPDTRTFAEVFPQFRPERLFSASRERPKPRRRFLWW